MPYPVWKRLEFGAPCRILGGLGGVQKIRITVLLWQKMFGNIAANLQLVDAEQVSLDWAGCWPFLYAAGSSARPMLHLHTPSFSINRPVRRLFISRSCNCSNDFIAGYFECLCTELVFLVHLRVQVVMVSPYKIIPIRTFISFLLFFYVDITHKTKQYICKQNNQWKTNDNVHTARVLWFVPLASHFHLHLDGIINVLFIGKILVCLIIPQVAERLDTRICWKHRQISFNDSWHLPSILLTVGYNFLALIPVQISSMVYSKFACATCSFMYVPVGFSRRSCEVLLCL